MSHPLKFFSAVKCQAEIIYCRQKHQLVAIYPQSQASLLQTGVRIYRRNTREWLQKDVAYTLPRRGKNAFLNNWRRMPIETVISRLLGGAQALLRERRLIHTKKSNYRPGLEYGDPILSAMKRTARDGAR